MKKEVNTGTFFFIIGWKSIPQCKVKVLPRYRHHQLFCFPDLRSSIINIFSIEYLNNVLEYCYLFLEKFLTPPCAAYSSDHKNT